MLWIQAIALSRIFKWSSKNINTIYQPYLAYVFSPSELWQPCCWSSKQVGYFQGMKNEFLNISEYMGLLRKSINANINKRLQILLELGIASTRSNLWGDYPGYPNLDLQLNDKHQGHSEMVLNLVLASWRGCLSSPPSVDTRSLPC